MIVKKSLIFIPAVIIALLLSMAGCQKTPDIVERNGISKAEDKAEQEAGRMLNEQTTGADSTIGTESASAAEIGDAPSSSQSSGKQAGQAARTANPASPTSAATATETPDGIKPTPETYRETLSNGEYGVTINAKVIVPPDVTSCGRYTADFLRVNTDTLKQVFFGNQAAREAPGGYECTMGGTPANLIISGYSCFGFSWSEEFTKKAPPPSTGNNYAAGCAGSLDNAKSTAQKLLTDVGAATADIRLQSAIILPPRERSGWHAQSGTYEIHYTQYADNLPIRTDTANLFGGEASKFDVSVDSRGIASAALTAFKLTKEKDIPAILSLEQAVSLIRQKLPSLWLSPKVPIIEISLEYMVNEAPTGELYASPCWRFCVDKTDYYKLSIAEQRKHDSNDLAMDAATGEMFRIGDRYIKN